MGVGTADDAQLQSYSTGAVPCDPQEIRIVDRSGAQGFNVWTWKAECDGDTYYCGMVSQNAATCSKKTRK